MVEKIVLELEQRLRPIRHLQQSIWIFDIDNSRVLWASDRALDVWNAGSSEELVARDMAADMSATVANRLKQYQADFNRDSSKNFQEIWTLYPDDAPATIDVVFSAFTLPDGRMAMICEAIGQQSEDAQALRSAEALLHTSVMITLFASTGEPLYRNPAARASANRSSQTLQQRFPDLTVLQSQDVSASEEIKVVAPVVTSAGKCWHDITARRCLDAASGEPAWLISEVDVSRLKSTEERAQFLAEHDILTKLPNRNHVSIEFQRLIDNHLSSGKSGALIFLDLDRFKNVNDSQGHASGDRLLVEVSKRLTAIADGKHSVARLGGDEFLFLFFSADRKEVATLAAQIQDCISEPIDLFGRKVVVTPSIGISLFPEHGRSIDDLMRFADLAMYAAKDAGRNSAVIFNQAIGKALTSKIRLEQELDTAISEGQFVAYFQPRVSAESNEVVGAETLVRWIHPENGLIPPDEFIPAAETSGAIAQIGKCVFEQAVKAQRAWLSQGFNLRISVNLSPLQFAEESLLDDLFEILRQHDASAQDFELEITESVLLGHDQQTITKLHTLVEKGFRIAIDDFGTGYSNLAYLHRYPIRCLKIDRSFIQSESAQPIVELIVQMARLFKLDVVAEGVETDEQLAVLQRLGCEEYQGFLFLPPVDQQTFSDMLHKGKQLAA